MSTSPVQPDLLQYPISDLYLFAEYLTRAAYLAATGSQAPPFNPALPVKQWLDPNPTGQPYLAFDTTAGKTVELPIPAAVASAVNLPGAYNYPAFQDTPTDATLDWPYGVVSQINSDTVCLLPNAQALLPQLQPLMPAGKTLSVVDSSEVGVFHTVYGTDPRRQWGLAINGVFDCYAKTLLLQQAAGGVGAQGHWLYGPLSGEPVTTLYLQWIQDPQVTEAPAGAGLVPVPIRPLLPNEEFQLVQPPDPLFGTATWMVVRTDLQPAVTLAEIQQLVAQYNAQPGVTPVAVG